MKKIILYIVIFIAGTILGVYISNITPNLNNNNQILIDSLKQEQFVQDSLLKEISFYQDSLIAKKDSIITKIIVEYEKNINNIDTISTDANILLLSRNLSEESFN